MCGYLPTTAQERTQMLAELGMSSAKELYAAVPEQLFAGELNIPDGASELESRRRMTTLARKNTVFETIFRGAGAYRHYIPAIVSSVVNKEEFVTAYTPYQAEISQGVLQAIFEFQTMICALTGMDAANASVYDGATAAAEAVGMCCERKRTRALIAGTLNPNTAQVIKTYSFGASRKVDTVPIKYGAIDIDAFKALLGADVGCILLQQPNFFGNIEDIDALTALAHEAGAKVIVSTHPIMLALLKTPAEYGADIAVGEGQPLGMPLSFGGPYLGFMACKKELVRKLPGRIVGQTTDQSGRRAFVLTLQAREQHIRREKASSSICSNEALCALTASAYMAAMGPTGLTSAAKACYSLAHYAAERICALPGFERIGTADFGLEFTTRCPGHMGGLMNFLETYGILGGLPIEYAGESAIVWCFTEMNTRMEIDYLVGMLEAFVEGTDNPHEHHHDDGCDCGCDHDHAGHHHDQDCDCGCDHDHAGHHHDQDCDCGCDHDHAEHHHDHDHGKEAR